MLRALTAFSEFLKNVLFLGELALAFIADIVLLAFLVLDYRADRLLEECLGNLLLADLAFHARNR